MSTVAELLGSLVALHAFGWLHTIYAGTDNLANEHVTRKQATTSFPLVYVHMQLAYSLFRKGSPLRLKWRPRDLNQPVDDLTNGRFEKFCESLRVSISLKDVYTGLMQALSKHHDEMISWKGMRKSAAGVGMSKKRNVSHRMGVTARARVGG